MSSDHFKFVAPNQAQSYTAIGMIHSLLVTGKENANAYSMTEITVSPACGVPMHRHPGLEAFYVLEGTFSFQVGDQHATGEPGAFVTIPPMIFHMWQNRGTDLGRVLCLVVPGGMEQMFIEAGYPVTDRTAPPLAPAPQDLQRAVEVAHKYGVESSPDQEM